MLLHVYGTQHALLTETDIGFITWTIHFIYHLCAKLYTFMSIYNFQCSSWCQFIFSYINQLWTINFKSSSISYLIGNCGDMTVHVAFIIGYVMYIISEVICSSSYSNLHMDDNRSNILFSWNPLYFLAYSLNT